MIGYSVNEEKGVVIAKFEEKGKLAREIWAESISNKLYEIASGTVYATFITIDKIVDEVMMEREVVGKAKLMAGDTFDENVGKEIAKKDLLNRYMKAELQAQKFLVDRMSKDFDIVKKHISG